MPLSKAAEGWLEQAGEMWGGTGFVLHARDVPIRPDNLHRESVAASTTARLKSRGPDREVIYGDYITRVDTHGLRRTAGARWLAAGVPIFLVSKWLGHASVVTTERHYAGICEATHVAYIERMDAVG